MLRPHQNIEQVQELHGGDHPGTASFAVLTDDDVVIATATVRPEPCPWWPEAADTWRLRGMATEAAYRGQGVGTAVLTAALIHIAITGGRLVWCNARTPALSFYLRAGFAQHGRTWTDPQIGPHVSMWRAVSSAERG